MENSQRSISVSSVLRVPRHHAAWDAFVRSLAAEMSEDEVLTLTIDTCKALAKHNGFTSPLDVAHIELAWGERQNQLLNASDLNGTQNGEEELPEVVAESPAPKPAPKKTVAKTPGARPASGKAPAKTPGKKPATNGTSPKPATPAKAGSPAAKKESPRGSSPTPRGVSFQRGENSGNPDGKIVRKDVGSRIDTGAVRRATSYEEDEVICVEDCKDVFKRYSAFANGNMKELDGSRFSKMIRECDLIDKLFTLREADVLFTKCKKSSADRRIPYHVFRMKLLPEMAAKKHTAISEIIKMLNHHGGPEIKQRVHVVQEEPEEEEYYEEEEVQQPPPPPAPVTRKAGSASRSTPTKTTGAKVPPLKKIR